MKQTDSKIQYFEKNCEKWSQTDPKKAVLLPYVNTEDLKFCKTEHDEPNLRLKTPDKQYFLHSNKGALEEAKEWFHGLDLKGIPLIYVYGVGLGYYYQAAKQWLHQDPSHRIVFIEDNLAVIHQLFETQMGYELLHDPQVQLHFFEGMEQSKELFNILYWNFFLTTMEITGLKLYLELKKDLFAELQHKLQYDAALKNGLLIEYLEFGVGFFKNFYPNILSLEGAFLGNDLFGKFKDVPAIICGAGPSLEKNLAFLRKLSNKALLFAGGSALNAINSSDIQAHFGAGIDPNAPQYDRLSTNTTFEVPFFYRNRLFHQAFKTIHGPRLYVTGSGGYDISHLFEENLGIEGASIEEGHNVVNFCLEIAHQLGCNPIIFVGMDLAYTGMKAYAPGVVEDSHVEKELITRPDHVDQSALLKKDIFGQPIYTLWKWISEAEWIGDFAKENPHVKLINATEGGLGFPGVSNLSLEDVAKKYLKEDYDLKAMIHSAVLNAAMPHIKNEKVLNIIYDLNDSLQRCVEDLNILIEETEEIKTRIKAENRVPFPLQTGKASLYESDLSEEAGYRYVLHIFNEAYTHVLNRELQALHTLENLSEVDLTLGKQDILIKRFAFLRNVALMNRELIQMALQTYVPQSAFPIEKPGKIRFDQDKKLGRLEGDSIYYSQSCILSKAKFENGLQVQQAEYFYPNGKHYSIQQFHEGLWHGKQEFYYPNGKPKTFLEYEFGKFKNAKLYHPSGELKLERSQGVK